MSSSENTSYTLPSPKNGREKELSTLHPGMYLDHRYLLLDRMAIGGMGEVWKAQDKNLDKTVAMKILRPELAGQKLFLSRLRIESQNARQVQHPNLAHVYNSGEQNGLGWIAMELVEGRALTHILYDHPVVQPDFLLSVLYQCCGALGEVHRCGIVHRDIKPGNILITDQGVVKLTDFGISKATNQITLTADGMVMGTAQYLSPEQAIGKDASPAGDFYALGVIAYEALTGDRPFKGERPVDIAFAHVNSPVPTLPAEIPAPLRDLIYKLLLKDPEERPHNASDLRKLLVNVWSQLPHPFYQYWGSEHIPPVPPPGVTVPENQVKTLKSELCPFALDSFGDTAQEGLENELSTDASSQNRVAKRVDVAGKPLDTLAGGTVAAPALMPDSFPTSSENLRARQNNRPNNRRLSRKQQSLETKDVNIPDANPTRVPSVNWNARGVNIDQATTSMASFYAKIGADPKAGLDWESWLNENLLYQAHSSNYSGKIIPFFLTATLLTVLEVVLVIWLT